MVFDLVRINCLESFIVYMAAIEFYVTKKVNAPMAGFCFLPTMLLSR